MLKLYQYVPYFTRTNREHSSISSDRKFPEVVSSQGVIVLENLTEMLKGILEGCVLEIISREQTYGYEITRKLEALGFTDVVEGTVYTILVRLEKNMLVDIVKKTSDVGPPRKIFTLNDAGREELRKFWEKWEFIALKISMLKEEHVLDVTGEDVVGFCDELLRSTKVWNKSHDRQAASIVPEQSFG